VGILEHAQYATPQYATLQERGAIESKESYTWGNETFIQGYGVY